MWASNQFRVSAGRGGAISTSGRATISIVDSSFSGNDAPQGASLSITAATSTRITNTTIDQPADDSSSAVRTIASSVDTCVENPCDAGSQCTYRSFSTFCEPCGENEYGEDGISCDACLPGTRPDELHARCLPCSPGQYSQIGICIFCPAGKTGSADHTGCIPCGPCLLYTSPSPRDRG